MVAAGIVHQDRGSRRYVMPAGHKQVLVRAAAFSPLIVQLGSRYETIKNVFQEDGPWGRFTRKEHHTDTVYLNVNGS